MTSSDFKTLVEQHRELLGEDLYKTILSRLEDGTLTENVMKYVVHEIETVKKAHDIAHKMDEEGARIYKEGTDKMTDLKNTYVSKAKKAVREVETSEHEHDVEEAEKLLSDL